MYVALLECLKQLQLHPIRWENIAKDTKILAEVAHVQRRQPFREQPESQPHGARHDELM